VVDASAPTQKLEEAPVAVATPTPVAVADISEVAKVVPEVVSEVPQPANPQAEPVPEVVAPIAAAEVVEIVSPASPKALTPPVEVRSATPVPALPRKNVAARARRQSQVVKPAEGSLNNEKEAPLVSVPLDG
jgi:hypothetical protein